MKYLILLFSFLVSIANAQIPLADAQYLQSSGVFKNPLFAEGLSGWTITGGCTTVRPTPPLNRETQELKLECSSNNFKISQSTDAFKNAQSKGMLLELTSRLKANFSAGTAKIRIKADTDVLWEQDLSLADEYFSYPYLFLNREGENLIVEVEGTSVTGDLHLTEANIKKSVLGDQGIIAQMNPDTGWTEWQPITITGGTTNPTKGTVDYDICRKRRNGTQLELEFQYLQSADGAAGNGVYFASCGGLELNGESLTPDYDTNPNVGDIFIQGDDIVAPHVTSTVVYDLNEGAFWLGGMGASLYPLTGERRFRATASIAIKEWRQSTVAMSSQNDISNLDNIPYYTAIVDGTVSPSIVSEENVDWITGDCARTATGRWSCTVPAAAKVNPDLCMTGRTNSSVDGNAVVSIAASSIPTRVDIVANTSTAVDVRFNLTCFKDKAGFEKAWKKTATAYLDAKYMSGLSRYIVKTYQSGTDWYEVYNDGWVRQRGQGTGGDTTSGAPISLVIPMKDNSYSPILTRTRGSTLPNLLWSFTKAFDVTATGFKAATAFLNESGSAKGTAATFIYFVEGYGDSAAVKALGANPNY